MNLLFIVLFIVLFIEELNNIIKEYKEFKICVKTKLFTKDKI